MGHTLGELPLLFAVILRFMTDIPAQNCAEHHYNPVGKSNNARKEENNTDVQQSHLSDRNIPDQAIIPYDPGMSGRCKTVRNS